MQQTTNAISLHSWTERHEALLERDGKLSVVVPVYRTSQMGVMTVRGEAELAALKAKARQARARPKKRNPSEEGLEWVAAWDARAGFPQFATKQ